MSFLFGRPSDAHILQFWARIGIPDCSIFVGETNFHKMTTFAPPNRRGPYFAPVMALLIRKEVED